MSETLCESLDWDSGFFGVRVARVKGNRLTVPILAEVEDWCRREKVECLYFLCAPDHDESILLAEGSGFHFVDCRMTFRWTPGKGKSCPPPDGIRRGEPGDLASLEAISADSYRQSRFYTDSRFPAEKASALYREWARKSLAGWADAVWVAPSDGAAGAFVTCHLDPGGPGRIGLVGVADGFRGQGLGLRIVRAAQSWFAQEGVESATVATQGRNLAAQRLYQKAGFLSDSVGYWYHRWFPKQAEGA